MSINGLLEVSINTFGGFGKIISLNGIGKIVQWLIGSFGSIGVGIIVFTLALKLITLPLDIISRTTMKKSSLKMQQMQPKLEKLQRQYANNKELYNKKIQALYKEQGYSLFSSCLPTLVSVVIFIVVITQFNIYSNFTEWQLLNDMSAAYTKAIEDYDDAVVYKLKDGEGNLIKKEDGSFTAYLNENYVFDNADEFAAFRAFVEKTPKNEYEASYKTKDINGLAAFVKDLNQKGFAAVRVSDDESAVGAQIIKSGDQYVFNSAEFGGYNENGEFVPLSDDEINARVTGTVAAHLFDEYASDTVRFAARTAAKKHYDDNAPSFLWIKNLWMPDLPFRHPVASSINDYSFVKNAKYKAVADNDQFVEITMLLSKEKSSPNGYFVLVILSIGLMLLSQFIMQKSQKAQLQYQSVDGSAAANSKMMMIMMPIMFGVFAFLYSGAFSLYMVVSTAFSIVSTMLINFFVEKAFASKYGA